MDAKYDNDFILSHIMGPACVDVLSRINNTSMVPIILKFAVTLDSDTERYKLPPCAQEVVRLVVVDDNGNVIYDAVPRDRMSYGGSRWSLEGNAGALELVSKLPYGITEDFELWYVSNGDFFPHYATDGTLNADLDEVTLSTTPTLGRLDRRVNGYAGGILRLLPASPDPIEERIIQSSSFDGTDWKVTTNLPFTHAEEGPVTYEIAPAGSNAMYEAIACLSAMKLGVPRKITNDHMERLRIQYKMALKTIGDNLTGLQARTPANYVKDTVDSPLGRQWGFWGR